MADFLRTVANNEVFSEARFQLRAIVRGLPWLRRIYQFLRNPQMRRQNAILRQQHQLAGALPIPPGRLIYLVQGSDSVQIFLVSGLQSAQMIRDLLAKHQVQLEELSAILDFGCGVGRVMRHWVSLKGPKLYGCDVNPELIAWCKENLPYATFQQNQPYGRLDLPDNTFDLIYAISIFTHLDAERQFFWMNELKRVLRPGGLLLFTTHGDYYLSRSLRPRDRQRYQQGELIVYGSRQQGSNVCVAYHPFKYVSDHLAAGLELLDFVPENILGTPCQDVYLFRKPDRVG